MNDYDEMRDSFSFLIDDYIQPSLIVHLNGDVLHVNEPFKILSGKLATLKIKSIIDSASERAFRAFVTKAAASKVTLVNSIPTTVYLNETYTGEMHVLSNPGHPIIIMKFKIETRIGSLSVKKYINAFNRSSNAMVLVDEQGIIQDVNIGYINLFDSSKEDMIGKEFTTIIDLIDPENDYDYSSYFASVKNLGIIKSTKAYQRSIDDIRHYHITTTYDKETTLFFVEIEDCTEKENLQVQLAHSGSLSAVGQIAASIAHEIRNPITTLKGFTQLLKASATDESIRYISVIEDEIDRMESILSEMLLLSKPITKKKSIFSLTSLICDMVEILKPKAVMDEIEIETLLNDKQDAFIFGDSDKFKQVLLNLFKNALESMTSGGKLSIKLSEVESEFMLSIQDTGTGMSRHHLNQVFMPFFSSKTGGTGLGLPFVLKIVEEHGGTISVDSQIDKGTQFIVTLPKGNSMDKQVNSSGSHSVYS
ncbi:PAS domain-containing sensor histidine kinase [Sporosarcina sp. Sa2YVA2]|uniref:histidine kinase n=1 Tax=Sporosarcina quadrami TaxID=2762234 RepID=A0ABR8U5M8_9BACL|nr:ATP-binding protein [Sporosarcina quadrami]MBD7983347.1 PAS domain-containing sensor histidine kinase [Sporosarcina quadrami]